MQRALDSSVRLIQSILCAVAESEECAVRRPVRATRKLDHASGQLRTVTRRLGRAAHALGQANACIARHPERSAGAPAKMIRATYRFVEVSAQLTGAAGEVWSLQEDVIAALEAGELVPEPDFHLRPRIVLVPRPAPVRAFLRARLPRVIDRIAPLLRRRRHTRLPASLRVPRRTAQGRAPPLSSICLL
jgi:hypothetical protein